MSKKINISDTKPNKSYYYEFVDNKSSKFWEITVKENTYLTRFGRIGSQGRTNTKEWASQEEAVKKATQQRNAKIKKGYIFKK